MLLELDSYEPVFPRPEESPEEAVRRARPALVVLLELSLETARSDVFHARAKGTPIVLFGPPDATAEVRALAAERRVSSFVMPVDRATLKRVVQEAIAPETMRSGRDRRRPSAREGVGGTVIFRDREGAEWLVYDRRRGDRRGHGLEETQVRAFVNDAGEEWQYDLPNEEVADVSPGMLERQLARALKDTPASKEEG
ncbi:MAG TPA: hypothetical protein VFO56_04020 [Gaiellaceae bacterium]|nr:hypothetical protein [Gaiellaceae bacterium]